MDVYEFIENNDSCITGWIKFDSIDRPDLIESPILTEKMRNSLRDEYNRYKFRKQNNIIIEIQDPPSAHDIAINEITNTQIFKLIKAIINGIDTSGNGAMYNNLKTKINRIQNGFE